MLVCLYSRGARDQLSYCFPTYAGRTAGLCPQSLLFAWLAQNISEEIKELIDAFAVDREPMASQSSYRYDGFWNKADGFVRIHDDEKKLSGFVWRS